MTRALAVLVLVSGLAGCAGVELAPGTGGAVFGVHARVPADEIAALDAARPCCASLADLPFAALPLEKSTLDLDAGSPAFAFDTGKSFFAAFRLPDAPRPLEVRVTSRRHALTPAIAANRPVFSPALAVLDAQHRVRELFHEPGALTVGVPTHQNAGIEVSGTVYVEGPPAEAAYLVVLTTDALRARSAELAGVKFAGFSPVGIIDLDVRGAPFVRPPVSFRSDASLVAPEGAAPLSATGMLFVDRAGVHYVEERDRRYVERVAVPFARIVSARYEPRFMGSDRLLLDTAEADGAPIVRRAFALAPERSQRLGDLRAAQKAVTVGIAPGWYRETIAVDAGSAAPEVVFRDPPAAAATAAGRVAEGAMTGGMLTAGVCALCYGGVCPPEVLLSCAGLFAVGAAVGGVASLGGELVSGAAKPPTPRLPAAQIEAGSPAVRSHAQALLAQDALRRCVLRRAGSDALWVEQGRAATLVPQAAAPRFVLRTSVDRVALIGEGKPGESADAMPVRLVAEGSVTLRDTASGREDRREASWQGPSHTLAQWTSPDGRSMRAALDEACEALAGRMLATASSLWREAR